MEKLGIYVGWGKKCSFTAAQAATHSSLLIISLPGRLLVKLTVRKKWALNFSSEDKHKGQAGIMASILS